MAFEGLTERLQNAMSKLRRKGKITESDVRDAMREIRLALLEADVNFGVVKDFVKTVRERAIGSEVLESLTPAQQIVKIVDEELTKVMGEEAVPLNKAPHIPTIIMMVGLQGAGKTTTAGKLAYRLKENEHGRPLFIAADVYRPAAIDQLQVVAQQVGAPVFQLGTDVDPREIVRQGLAQAAENKNDYVIIDTAGRLQIDEKLMQELADIKELAQPNEILLTVDAMTGQNAVNVAESFNQQLDITGVVLTKLDGDTRGGAALSIRAVTGKPIKFTGQGEKLTDLDVFHPDRMADRILGMGDMLTLIEKAQTDYDEKKANELAEKMQENTFDFNDFIDQLDQVQKMGGIQDILKMMPGMNNVPGLDKIQMGPKEMGHMKAVVYSMTPSERTNPDLLNPSRRRRIAAGAGRPIQEVNRMIKQFKESRKMMSKMSNGNFAGMDQMFGQGISGRLGKMAMGSMVRKQKKQKQKRLKQARKRRK
ncbi:signal recognition particle protein [Loigolactobacillus coryniformis]|jgi:signal recognition particle subunit SRP54|uniref:Signal recognition particle protein n=3 Tax=Loigolactobacillus coryniformis TaxID=1610 RepID=J2ZU78_9LACO|nr:signal recognition particle protein [Loigolactobacillus coryniformis]MDT3391178.1 signal recognition particle protein [Bacillota bacterium]OEH90451.1 signal recognition particle [Loigolactobacillus coryniformis subsp. coryniformis]ATO43962.1 signal recognition particle protein [Loigolactobacillus coryniformis subsp. torquens DSM 20004 = KCTC 3535]ATO55635.1 signal recognition particle protein [Loigolactobacillus coryniformis subsp. coryniformis KCTC 3167 = DSM 20001]EJN56546.1 Signal recogn